MSILVKKIKFKKASMKSSSLQKNDNIEKNDKNRKVSIL